MERVLAAHRSSRLGRTHLNVIPHVHIMTGRLAAFFVSWGWTC